MSATAKNIDEAADKVDKIGALIGLLEGRAYNRQGRISAAREHIGLTPTQGRRAAYREWKQVPSQIMDVIREKYAEIEARAEAFADHQHALAEIAQREKETPHAADTGDDSGLARHDRQPGLRNETTVRRARNGGMAQGDAGQDAPDPNTND